MTDKIQHDQQGSIQLTYCFCDFHPACPPASMLEIGGVGYIFCPSCRRLGHMDIVGHRVSTVECKEVAKWRT